MIKAVIFDWDLTLAKTLLFRTRLFHHFCKLAGISFFFQSRRVRTLFGMSIKDILKMTPAWASKRQALALYKTEFRNHARLMHFVGKKVILELQKQGYKVAVLTNDLAEHIQWYVRKQGLRIPVMSTGDHPKPSPIALKNMMRQLRVKPSETVYVGDHPKDIKFGKNAGVRTIALKTFLHTKRRLSREKPDAVVSSLGDVPRYVRGW